LYFMFLFHFQMHGHDYNHEYLTNELIHATSQSKTDEANRRITAATTADGHLLVSPNENTAHGAFIACFDEHTCTLKDVQQCNLQFNTRAAGKRPSARQATVTPNRAYRCTHACMYYMNNSISDSGRRRGKPENLTA